MTTQPVIFTFRTIVLYSSTHDEAFAAEWPTGVTSVEVVRGLLSRLALDSDERLRMCGSTESDPGAARIARHTWYPFTDFHPASEFMAKAFGNVNEGV